MDQTQAKKPESVLAYAIKSVVVIVLVTVVVVLAVVNVLFQGPAPDASTPGANPNPPAGEIWLGVSGTAHQGEVIHAWAHLTRAVGGPSDVRVRIAKDGAAAVDQAANSLSPAGDVVRFSYTLGNAGNYAFTVVVASDGSVLATSTLSVK